MTLWSALSTAWSVGRETSHAVTAAQEKLTAGASPFAALHAFAEATEGKLDDDTLATLESALRTGVTTLAQVTRGMAWTVSQETMLRAALDTAMTTLVSAGYTARHWRHTLEGWLE